MSALKYMTITWPLQAVSRQRARPDSNRSRPISLRTRATDSRYVRRSQNKAQGWRAGVKGQNLPRVRQVSSQKPLTFFKGHPQPRPSSACAPVPCAPMCCFFSSLVGPGCITPRPQSEPNRLCVSKVRNDAVMMPRR